MGPIPQNTLLPFTENMEEDFRRKISFIDQEGHKVDRKGESSFSVIINEGWLFSLEGTKNSTEWYNENEKWKSYSPISGKCENK